MRTCFKFASLALSCLFAASCVTSGIIADGRYASAHDQIVINGKKATLDVTIGTGSKSWKAHREYGYFVDDEGSITWLTMTSGEAVLGVGRYDWIWNGHDRITKLDTRSPDKQTLLKNSLRRPKA